MSIEVTLRHTTESKKLKDYAYSRAQKILLQFPKIEHIHVVLDVQRHLYEADFIVQRKGVTVVGAKVHADSFMSVIDTAASRAEKQLKKLHDKRIDSYQATGTRA